MAESKTIIRFACACQKISGSVNVPTSTLPLSFEYCHCTTCRHQSGLLAVSYLSLPKEATDLKIEGPLTEYRTSYLTRTFCSHCGANISAVVSNTSPPDVLIATGILDKAEGVIELRDQLFVPDSGDDGLAAWLPDIPAWTGYPQKSEEVKIDTQKPTESSDKRESKVLNAYCHCKGVQLKITPPNEPIKDSDDNPWYLRASNTKYLAGTCACPSCRLASGFDIQFWAFIPKSNIRQSDDTPLDFNAGTLKEYSSSEGVSRNFCSNCGATVFWHNVTRRPNVIDVSVGLLDAEEGARAERWLEWWDKVSFGEMAQNKGLVERLGKGLKGGGGRGDEGRRRDEGRMKRVVMSYDL